MSTRARDDRRWHRAWLGGLCLTVVLAGCGGVYERITIEPDGTRTVTAIEHRPSWWANLGEPDWMATRSVTIRREGRVIATERCVHEQPMLLVCERR